jgi:heat shock protein HslJ
MRPVRTAVAITVGLLVLGACGRGGAAGDQQGWPTGRTFLSTSVTGNGQIRQLVAGTRIELIFTDPDKIGVSAGCNSMGGTGRIDAGALVVTDLATTDMGCEQPLMEQDTWLSTFLTSRPAWSLQDNELVLSTNTTQIRLADRRVVDPDRPLAGTRWNVDTIIGGDSASSVPAGAAAYLVFGTATVDGSTGCQGISAAITVTSGTIVFPAQGIATATAPSCTGGSAALHAAVVATLRGDVMYTIEGPRLTLRGPGDAGLSLQAQSSSGS